MHQAHAQVDDRAPAPPVASEDSPLPAGTLLRERFLITQLIAEGGTSFVYRARDLLCGESSGDLAVKIPRLIPGTRRRLDLRREFALRELRICRRLSHPNIVRIYDVDRDGDLCFLTMEYLEGETLAQRLARSPGHRLTRGEALWIFHAAAEALAAAHGGGIVHGDVKPANLFLTSDGLVKLIDFAVAHAGIGEERFVGYSPSYASPEVLAGAVPQAADDVYGLACVLYEMLCGRATGDRRPRPSSLRWTEWTVLRRALSPRRQNRPGDAGQFLRALSGARGNLGAGIAACVLIAVCGAAGDARPPAGAQEPTLAETAAPAALTYPWAEASFGHEDLLELERLARLSASPTTPRPSLPTVARRRLAEQMHQAGEARDFPRLVQLATFHQRAADLRLIPAQEPLQPPVHPAALQLAAYHLTPVGAYPAEAARQYWKPYLDGLAQQAGSLWLDRDLNRLRLELERLRPFLPAGYRPYLDARARLAAAFQTKARYYLRLGDRLSARELQVQAANLVDK